VEATQVSLMDKRLKNVLCTYDEILFSLESGKNNAGMVQG
jgi:hypothetical protein